MTETEFINMFLNPIITTLVGGLMVYYFSKLNDKIAELAKDMAKLKEDMIQGNVVTELFKDHMSTHSHKE